MRQFISSTQLLCDASITSQWSLCFGYCFSEKKEKSASCGRTSWVIVDHLVEGGALCTVVQVTSNHLRSKETAKNIKNPGVSDP